MPEMMKYRKTGKFKLGFLTLLLSVLFVACGSERQMLTGKSRARLI